MTPTEEHALASFLARPEWPVVRPLLQALGVPMKPLDDLVKRVRREQWRDFSNG